MVDAGYFIQRECARAFRQVGWKILPLAIDPLETYIERLLTAVVFAKPDLLFTVNHLGFDAGGVLAGLLTQVALPAVSWFVDSPAYIILNHPGAVSPVIITPVWERTEIATLRRLGFEHPFHLPLAADPDLMRSGETSAKRFAVGFVGDSMEEAARKWRLRCPQDADLDRRLQQGVERLLGDREASPSAGDLPAEWSAPERLNFASAVVLEATRRYRQEALTRLGEASLRIWGDEGWRQAAPPGAIVAPRVDYYRELPLVYRRTAINLNFTSFQMPTAVNQRVFDAPVAGGFLLTDDQPDLTELFRPDEVATFGAIAELKEKVNYFTRRPDAAELIRRRAARRILSRHTYRCRIETIVSEARRRFGPLVTARGQTARPTLKTVESKRTFAATPTLSGSAAEGENGKGSSVYPLEMSA